MVELADAVLRDAAHRVVRQVVDPQIILVGVVQSRGVEGDRRTEEDTISFRRPVGVGRPHALSHPARPLLIPLRHQVIVQSDVLGRINIAEEVLIQNLWVSAVGISEKQTSPDAAPPPVHPLIGGCRDDVSSVGRPVRHIRHIRQNHHVSAVGIDRDPTHAG